MTARRAPFLAAAAAALLLAGGFFLWWRVPAAAPIYQGYVEGEYLRIGAPVSGTLTSLAVRRGEVVAAGAPLFSLDLTSDRAARDEAAAALAQAEANLADLEKGKRPSEIAAIEAQKAQAEADLAFAEAQLARQEALARTGNTALEKRDEARSNAARLKARIDELAAQLATARLAGREDAIRAARATVEMQRQSLARTERRLVEMTPAAREAALVEDTMFRPGEWVAANAPVVTLLPPGNIKLRFFVPERLVGSLRLGDGVRFRCDGCPAGQSARITFIAPRAEYTPPVIYSIGSRDKLVFLVEAAPEGARERLHPGQPVDVELSP